MPEESHSAVHKGLMGEESPRLYSALPVSDGRPDGYSQVCAYPSEDEAGRPMSLVSTLSSGYGSTATLPSSALPPPGGEDIDLELSPAGGARPQTQAQLQGLSPGEIRDPWLDRGQPRFQYNDTDATGAFGSGTSGSETPVSPFATEAMTPNPKLSYVDRVVMEIIETERMYVRDLRSIVEDYLAHIIDMHNLPIEPKQVSSLFGNIEDIYEFNSELLNSLDLCENDPVAVARCFVDKSDDFEIYTQYCTNYPNSVGALTDCMRSKTLAKFFRDRQAFLKRSLPLGSYLLKPVQRILKYHLLLQEIAKHFDPEEEGYEIIREAIDTMTAVGWYINDMKRKHEHAVRLQEIQSLLINWKGPDLTTFGELVLEGTFSVQRAKNTRTLFLFDKMLLFTKKRGDHYVYKTHISCSTLMLLDSAKEPLHFSVIHFKQPKQPHIVQAKTVEEKRIWAHHIKRLILENHHTIIPQKAKEGFLDMDSLYPGSGRYRYSPERLEKTSTCQTEHLPTGGRNGRRRSEPAKQIARTTKDSEGALLGDWISLQQPVGIGTLDPDPVQPDRPSVHEELGRRRCSLEPLPARDRDSLTPESPPGQTGRDHEEQTREIMGDVLMVDNQVADFGSSMLAAISCWHNRATALLSAHFPTAHVEEVPRLGSAPAIMVMEPHEDLPAVHQVSHALSTLPPRLLKTPEPEERRGEEEERAEEEKSYAQEKSYREDEEQSDCSALHQDTMNSSGANGDCSELGEGDEDGAMKEETDGVLPVSVLDQASGISEHLVSVLPVSVLDQASGISEHLVSSLSPSGSVVVTEDLRSLSCPSSCKENRTTSQSPDLRETSRTVVNSIPKHPLLVEAKPFAPASIEFEGRSSLSNLDQILIHKIRTYYENAEHQDASFSIKRRESLSYIPAGLVRQLSKQLNGSPQEQALPGHRKVSPNNRPTSWSVFDLPGLEKDKGISDASVLEPQKATDVKPSSQCLEATPAGDEEELFGPSIDMIQVWRDMETDEFNKSLEEPKGIQKRGNIVTPSLHPAVSTQRSRKGGSSRESPEAGNVKPLEILEESYTGTVLEESPALIPSDQDCSKEKTIGSEERVSRTSVPRITSLRSQSEDDLILQDMERMKNKVFQLARQYSQRIKNSRPVVRQRNRESENQLPQKNLPAVYEEQFQRGRPNLTLSLNPYEQLIMHELSSLSPVPSLSSGASSRVTSPCPNGSSSPVQTESFHWPDVQELRSKYANPRLDTGASRLSPVSRSCSVPDATESCSEGFGTSWSHTADPSGYNPSTDTISGQTETESSMAYLAQNSVGEAGLQPPMCRWNSLDHMLGTQPLHELQNLQTPMRGCSVTCQASLPNDRTVIVVERVPGAMPAEMGEGGRVEVHGEEGKGKLTISNGFDYQYCAKIAALTSVQKPESSLVKNLRAKFQNLGSNA
ncbi:hypothetical protein DPEC_G00315660 [Dallia pectoralis]|uniref:Uncharacterized protein n=1 Tax=Dallia pectoralis TaxID=75939 RepID=A0ACC2FCB1_DALPE|nr:hypothetical protein DPEC_G00315660 [Dallia pectoralis]